MATTQHNNEALAVEDGRGWNIWIEREFWQSRAFDLYEKAVYVSLCGYADRKTHDCWPSIQTIADELNISKNTVRRALGVLIEMGLLGRTRRPLGKGLLHDTNVYVIRRFRGSAADELRSASRELPSASDDLGYSTARTTVVHPVNPNELHRTNPSEQPPQNDCGADAPRVRKPPANALVFEALTEVCGADLARMTPEEKAPYQRPAASIHKAGYSADDVRTMAANWPTHFGEATMTATGIVKYASRLMQPGNYGNRQPQKPSTYQPRPLSNGYVMSAEEMASVIRDGERSFKAPVFPIPGRD